MESALKEWRKLAPGIRDQLKNKLRERPQNPRVSSARLHGLSDCYKIKLRTAGYRLVYQVNDKVGHDVAKLVYDVKPGMAYQFSSS